MIDYTCENCGQLLQSRPQSIGKKRRCPACQSYTIVDNPLPVSLTRPTALLTHDDDDEPQTKTEREISYVENGPNQSTDFVLVRDDELPRKSTGFVITGDSKGYQRVPGSRGQAVPPAPPTQAPAPPFQNVQAASRPVHAAAPINEQLIAGESAVEISGEGSRLINAVVVDIQVPFARKIQICFEWLFAFLCVVIAVGLVLGVLLVPALILSGFRLSR